MLTDFEHRIHQDLHQHLIHKGALEAIFPDAPDIEEKWESIAQSYIPDGIREYADYPTVSLGWMMYLGMAVARRWDEDWLRYRDKADFYEELRDPWGFDNMDEYIRQEVLHLSGEEYDATERLVSGCASRTLSQLRHSGYEAGTKEAFSAYVACLHQLYLMGAAVELLWLGYHMQQQ